MAMYYYKFMNKAFGFKYATFNWGFGTRVGRVFYDIYGKPFCYYLGETREPVRYLV